MKKSFVFGLISLLLVTTVFATTDEQLNDFFEMYASDFQITTLWAGEAITQSDQVAKLSIINLKWTDNQGNVWQERRFYANFQGSASDVVRHFDDGKNIETLITYPQGTCEQKALDGSCGVKSFDFNYAYNYTDPERVAFHKFNIEVDPVTGQATEGMVEEIIVDATYSGKWDFEDNPPPNIQNKQSVLTFVNQNGIISEDTTIFSIELS